MIHGYIYFNYYYCFNHHYHYYFTLLRNQTVTKTSYLNVIILFSILKVPINAGFGRMHISQ